MGSGKNTMTCTQCRESLAAWLEARWDGQGDRPPGLLLEHAAGCPACGARLEAALSLLQGPERRPLPPPGLAQRIGERLGGQPTLAFWPNRAAGTQRPGLRRVLIPLAAALAAALGTAALFALFAPRAETTVVVRFELVAPQAREVSLVGDWNGWDPEAQRLADPDRDGVWEIRVPLRRGQEHQYQFLVDGSRWVADPDAPLKVEDGLGGYNSVLQI
jgi:hypothetical protein